MSPLVNALVYGVPSLIIGFAAGRLTRQEVVFEVEHRGDGEPVMLRPQLTWLRRNWRHVIGWVVLAVTLISTILVVERQNAAAACAERAFSELTNQLNIGSQIGSERDDAHAVLLRTILAAKTPEEGTAAIADYLKAKADRDARLAARGPYRTFQEVCG